MIDPTPLLEQLAQLDLMPMLLAILVGGAIGLEREVHGRPAGLRTHIMVCLSSAILIQASHSFSYMDETGSLVERIVYDPNRVAAGVVTGIGFLGAAAVIRAGDIVRGITTGACVWAVAVLGVVIGQGRYGLALAAAGLMLVVLIAFDWLFAWIKPVIYRRLVVRGSPADAKQLIARVRELLREHRIAVQDAAGKMESGADLFELELHVRCRNQLQAPGVLEEICALDGVSNVEWTHLRR